MTSQHCTPPFYWRGGDVLREREYITDEYRKALIDLERAEQDLHTVKLQVEAAANVLNERDGYTTALAAFMEGDPEGFTTENEMKRELIQLERDITHNETLLRKRRAVHNPGIASALQKEKAYYMIDIERHIKAIANLDDDKRRARNTMAGIAISPRWNTAIQTEYNLDKVNRKKRFLRSLVNRVKSEFDNTRALSGGQSDGARSERVALHDGLAMTMEIHRAEEKLERRPPKHANEINFFIEQIEDLNAKMIEIGMDAEVVDTQGLRERMLPPKSARVRVTTPRRPPPEELKPKPAPDQPPQGTPRISVKPRKPRPRVEKRADATPRRAGGGQRQREPDSPPPSE
jgi:hypothetical protein